MNIDTLQQRIRLGEDSTLELKRVAVGASGRVTEPHVNALSDELAAMANSAGGTLVLGVDDKTRGVTGIPHPVEDPRLSRSYLMERRGFGVETILTESERLSGRRPVYEQIGGLELCLTIFAASPPERDAPQDAPQVHGSKTA